MKFTCERCGKRFASVDEPDAGRVYRIRCRCGNVIHITSPHSDADGEQDPAAARGRSPAHHRRDAHRRGDAAPPGGPAQRHPGGRHDLARPRRTPADAGRSSRGAVADPSAARRTEAAVRAATSRRGRPRRPATHAAPAAAHDAERTRSRPPSPRSTTARRRPRPARPAHR